MGQLKNLVKSKLIMDLLKKKIFSGITLLFAAILYSYGQGPTHLPVKEPEPVSMTWQNILFYIVLPIGLFIFYIWWLRQKRKGQEDEKR
ncbi:MAG TPA: hypothetical protein VJ951_16655 [Bacteroidales bacterium]|nr:hypothetical protein [Bacteroidales bacterium]